MKKITLLICFLFAALYSQAQTNLLTNGDFETGTIDPWFGNANPEVRTEGGNSFFFANVENADPNQPFLVNLSQVVDIAQGQSFTLSFDASSDQERTILAGIGLNEQPFTNNSETINLTSTLQTFTLNLTATFGSQNSRVLFDLAGDTGVVVIDNVVLTLEDNGGGTTAGDELVINGNFESGLEPWFGNANPEIRTEGGNSFFFANIENPIPDQAFQVNLSQVINIEQGNTYTFQFDASSDRERTIIAGIGLNEAPFEADVRTVTLNTETQTFTYTVSSANFGNPNSRVLFDLAAEAGVVVIDNVSLKQIVDDNGGGNTDSAPTTAAPAPPVRDQGDVFSVYSDAYVDQPNVDFGAFGVGTQDITTETIDGDNFIKAVTRQPEAQFLFADWGTTVDVSDLTMFHFDYWIDTDLAEGLIVNPKFSNHVGDAGETQAFELNNPATTLGEWVSIDIPISSMNSIPAGSNQRRDALRQFVLTVAGAATGSRTVYVDNIYLYKEATAGVNDVDASNFRVFPNPSNGSWNISASDVTIQSVDVYSMLGNKVSSQMVEGSSLSIDNTSLSSGIYLAKVNTATGSTTIKLIKN